MLRITQTKSADSTKKYFCEKYYKEGHSTASYYMEKEQAIGRWGGKAAHALGLIGDISPKDFAALCDNINPGTGKTLTGRNDKDRSVAYDFTWSVNKSVSIAYLFGSKEEQQIILDNFQNAVRETMNEVEAGMQVRVRVNGQNENRLTGNIAYGEFLHYTTRPINGIPDPHLHIHAVVFNMSKDSEEQKWKAGQFKQLKQDAPYYEAIFQSKLAAKLQNVGYPIVKTKHGFELARMDKKTIDKFSRRTKEIEEYAEEHRITNAEQKAQIGAKTREAKRSGITAEQQEAAWWDRLTADELTAMQNLRQFHPDHKVSVKERNDAQLALQFSVDHHFERKSVASDKEILATAIKSSIGKATPEQVQQEFDKDTNLLVADEKLRRFITTKEALKEERQLIQYANQTKNKFRPINDQYEPQNPQLNNQQKAAVKHTLSSTDGIAIITGKAGTGKTTLMKEVQQGILASGKKIFSFAPSSEASRGVQRSEGFENADTVAMLIQDKGKHADLKHQVIWVDEAGMLSNKDMNHVFAIANAQSARVILSGDINQHQSIQRGDALRVILQETGIQPVTVNKIQRQQNAEYKQAVQFLSEGKTEKGFQKLDTIGAIHEMPDAQQRTRSIAEEYYQSAYRQGSKEPSKEVLVVAPTHAEGDAVTQRIRQELKAHEAIGQEDRSYTVLKNRQFTEAEKQQPESYQPGDWLGFHQNAKGIKAGSRLEVDHADESGISAKDQGGILRQIGFGEARKFSVYEQKQVDIAEGDKLRITANGKDTEGKHLFNGSTFQVEKLDEQGNISLSNGSTLPPDFGNFNLGYVATSHASQGKTADKVIISQSSATFGASSMEQFYVSVSRGREAVSIYTDDKEQLKDAVNQSTERKSATELLANGQVQEMNRAATQRKTPEQERPIHLTNPYNQHGLQDTARTEQYAR